MNTIVKICSTLILLHFASAVSLPAQIPLNTFYEKATALQDAGNYQDAVAYYTEVIMRDDENARALFNRGLCFMELEQYASAENDFTRLLQIQPRDLQAREIRGTLLLKKEEWKEAEADFSEVLQQKEILEVRLNRSIAYMNTGQLTFSKIDLEAALRIHPEHPAVLAQLGVLYNFWEQPEQAALYYRRALKQDTTNLNTLLNYGITLLQLKRTPEALQCFNKINAVAENPDALAYSAIAHLKMNKTEIARSEVARALSLSRINANVYFASGLLAMQQQQYEPAAEAFDLAIYFRPDTPEYYLRKAQALYLSGEYREAIYDCKKVLEKYPSHETARSIHDQSVQKLYSGNY